MRMPTHTRTRTGSPKTGAKKPAVKKSSVKKTSVKKTLGWWVRVVELLDPDLPRRDATKPSVTVSIVITEPSTWDDWAAKETAAGRPMAIRHDLSSRRALTTRALATDSLTALKKRLGRQGYTVNGNLAVHSVYVIELDAAAIPERRRPDGFRGYVYVGSTGKDPADRVEQHRLGTPSSGNNRGYSPTAHRHFVRRRPDLEPRRVFFDAESALLNESRTRVSLERRGFVVKGGQERLEQARGHGATSEG